MSQEEDLGYTIKKSKMPMRIATVTDIIEVKDAYLVKMNNPKLQNISIFAHRKIEDYDLWNVSDVVSGRSISKNKATRKAAIEDAISKLLSCDIEKYKQHIKDHKI